MRKQARGRRIVSDIYGYTFLADFTVGEHATDCVTPINRYSAFFPKKRTSTRHNFAEKEEWPRECWRLARTSQSDCVADAGEREILHDQGGRDHAAFPSARAHGTAHRNGVLQQVYGAFVESEIHHGA